MKLVAGAVITLALLLAFATISAPASADEPQSEAPATLSEILAALADYYDYVEPEHRATANKPDGDDLAALVDRYRGGGGTTSWVNVDSLANPRLTHGREFYNAYRDSFERTACGDRPTYTSDMYSSGGVAWQCSGGQWSLIALKAPSFLCEQFRERNRMYPQHTYVPPTCDPE
ncbi:MAG: hypothetical protein OXT70_12900 [Chloroflexota bacterium]|nr:hypothetical protein [Chloroflexota bacterium]